MKRTRGLWASIVFVAILVTGSLVGFVSGSLKPVLGLDLQGGVAVILSAPAGTSNDVMQQALTNIRHRVDAFGVGEPDIAVTGTTIQVQVPGLANSTIESRPKTQYCLVGADGSIYACGTTQAEAQAGLDALKVNPTPSKVCIEDKSGAQLKCYASQAEADAAKAGLSVNPQASPTPGASGSASGSASPSGAPSLSEPGGSPSAGPPPAPSAYCVTDPAGTELVCKPTSTEATAVMKQMTTVVVANTYCIVDGGASSSTTGPASSPSPGGSPTPGASPSKSSGKPKHASPTPSASPSASPAPSPYATLDHANMAALPCELPTKADATKQLSGTTVAPQTVQYCVVSSTKQDLGCYISRPAAVTRQQETSQAHLLSIIGKTARLEERPVLALLPATDPTPITCSSADTATSKKDCASFSALDNQSVLYPYKGLKERLGPVIITGTDITKATAVYNPAGQSNSVPQWVVNFSLSSEGSAAFEKATTTALSLPSPQNQIAIVVDRKIVSSPQVTGVISGTGQITGNFTQQSSKDLATVLNAGALPVQLEQKSVQTISPTLGKESLRQGIVAGVAGLILLFVYLLFYYRLLGVVAWFGMSIWAILALALISIAGRGLGYALSLAGIAGLVISLGVTADSYIVFFERLKDEVRGGKSPRSAVQPAFKRAYRTIVAADSVTLIAAVVLYLTAVSSVRGFALTLGVATLLDLFVVYFFKRPTVFLIARNDRLVSLPGFGLESGVAAEATDGSGA